MSTSEPIHDAAAEGHMTQVKALLDKDPSLLHARDGEYGWTPLIYAASEGQVEMVTYLLGLGADVDDRDEDGDTALQMACVHGKRGVVELLLERGADVRLADRDGRTPLMRACLWGYSEIVSMLLRHGGIDLDAADGRGQTALWLACSLGWPEAARLLLRAGADPTKADGQGRTPVDAARIKNRTACTRMLSEWECGYEAFRARRLRDSAIALHNCPAAQKASTPEEARQKRLETAPPYLHARVMGAVALPEVEAGPLRGAPDPEVGDNSTRKRPRAVEEEGEEPNPSPSPSPNPRVCCGMVLRHMVAELKSELFVELLSGL